MALKRRGCSTTVPESIPEESDELEAVEEIAEQQTSEVVAVTESPQSTTPKVGRQEVLVEGSLLGEGPTTNRVPDTKKSLETRASSSPDVEKSAKKKLAFSKDDSQKVDDDAEALKPKVSKYPNSNLVGYHSIFYQIVGTTDCLE